MTFLLAAAVTILYSALTMKLIKEISVHLKRGCIKNRIALHFTCLARVLGVVS